MMLYVITPLVVLACLVSILSSKGTIYEKQQELDAINAKIELLELENIEYARLLEEGNFDKLMEKLAAENPELNYGIPGEIRFYDLSAK
jgi:cell division protein FtsL